MITENLPANLPEWAALLVSALLLIGAGLTLLGAIGVLRLRDFFERMHGPALGVSWGAGGILLASMVFFSVTESRLVLHEIAIGAFIMLTAPIVTILLGRAVLYRERTEGSEKVPPISVVIARRGRPEAD